MQHRLFSSRFFALVLLCIILLFPLGWYSYFIIARQAELTLVLDKKIPFRVDLEGTFGNSFLPLADSILSRTFDCESTCSLSGLASARYEVTITATGYEQKQEKLTLASWERRELSIVLVPLARTTEFHENDPLYGAAEKEVTLFKQEFPQYESIELLTFRDNMLFVQALERDGVHIGILTADTVTPYFTIPWVSRFGVLDASHAYIIFSWSSTDIYSIVNGKKYTLPWAYRVFDVRENGGLEIVTDRWLLREGVGGHWQINPLFDDVIVLWDMYLWLVRDPVKKQILDLPMTTSDALYLIDTTTWDRRKILENTHALHLFMQDGHFWYVLANGKKMEILL